MRKWTIALLCAILMSPAIPVAAATLEAAVTGGITAVATDGVYNYVGTNDGKIYKQEIGGTISLVDAIPAEVTGLALANTTLYVTTSSGSIYSVAGASAGAIQPSLMLDNVIAPTAAQCYGATIVMKGAGTVTLPSAVEGMSICIIDGAATASDLIVDVQAADKITLTGVEGSAGNGVTNAAGSTLGDFICLVSPAAKKWTVMGNQGTWAAQQ